jgi:glutaredoxin 3
MSAVKNVVEKQIAENPVVVYSKSKLPPPTLADCVILIIRLVGWCPYCRQTKQTLSDFGASFQVYELDQIGMPSFLQIKMVDIW